MRKDNPAERLLNIIKLGKECKVDRPCREVWMEVLKAKDEAEMLIRIGTLASLPDQIVTILRQELEDEQDWRHWHAQIKHAFLQQQLHSQWNTFVGVIDNHSMSGLSMSARLIRTTMDRSELDFQKVSEIRGRLISLLEEINADETIEKELRKYLCRAILKIVAAVDEYAIRGIDGVMEAVDSLIGRVVVDENLHAEVQKSERARSVFDVVKVLVTTLSVAEKFPALVHGASNAVQHLPWLK